VNLRGGNPYRPAELLAEEKLADKKRTEAVMMWNPPPALAVYMPLGAIPPRWASLLWGGTLLVAVFVACDLLWRTYCERHRWVGAAIAISFVGTWWLVVYGQNTALLLLGLAGFIYYRRREKPLTAGAFAALTALKPHLLACFGVLLVADVLTRRGAKSLAIGVALIAAALGIALAANPAVLSQFIEATRNPAEGAIPLSAWELPVPAYWLRKWAAPTHFWVQFVPCALACTAFLVYRVRKGAARNWSREMPLIVAVSVLTTPYGGWIFDLPVLLVPAVWAAARLVSAQRWCLAGAFVLGQAIITAMSFAWVGELRAYWWVAPAVLGLCLLALARRS
jgi:hypothetical protein